MANKTTSTYEFKITSDASQFLTELKKVRDAAESAGLDKKILGNIDKEFANAQKLLTNYQASLQNDKSVKGIDVSQKALEKLNSSYAKLGVLVQQASKAENFKPNLAGINQLKQIQQSLLLQQDQLKTKAENYLDSKRKDFKLTQDETNELKKQLDNYEQLKTLTNQILQSRQSKLTSTAAKIGIGTGFGQTALANQQTIIESSALTSGLFTPAERKKANKDKSDLRTSDKKGLVDTATVTIAREYAEVLEKIAVQEISVDQGIENFTKSLAEYGIAVSDANALQTQFQQSLESIAQETISNKGSLSSSDKGKITKAQNEVTAAQGLVTTGINSNEIQALTSNLQQVEQTEEQINQALINQQSAAQQAAQAAAQGAAAAQSNNEKIIQQENEDLNLKRQNAQAQNELNNTFERMSVAVKQVLSLTSAWRMLRQVVQQTFNDVKNLDKSFAEIAMVTSYSVKDMWSSYNDYAQMANDLGQSTESVIKASGLFYQQGLNTAESLELTEQTMKLATLAGLDFSEATSQMTAALRGFHMEMDQGSHITDVYSELAAKAAADVSGIAYAMSKTSSIASSAGMSFENTAAFLTTMIEATQEAPRNYLAA